MCVHQMICNRMLVIVMMLIGAVHASESGGGWGGHQPKGRADLRSDDNEDQVAEVARNVVLNILRSMRMEPRDRPGGSGKKAKWACWNQKLPQAMWTDEGYCRLEIRVVADPHTTASRIKSRGASSSSNTRDSTGSCSTDTKGGSSNTRDSTASCSTDTKGSNSFDCTPPSKKQKRDQKIADALEYMAQLLWVGYQVPAAQARLPKMPDNIKNGPHAASLDDIRAHVAAIENVLDSYEIDPEEYIDTTQGCHTYMEWLKRRDEDYDPDDPAYGGNGGGTAGMLEKYGPGGTHC